MLWLYVLFSEQIRPWASSWLGLWSDFSEQNKAWIGHVPGWATVALALFSEQIGAWPSWWLGHGCSVVSERIRPWRSSWQPMDALFTQIKSDHGCHHVGAVDVLFSG